MKVLTRPLRTKAMPIIATALLTAGTLTSCSSNYKFTKGSDNYNHHYIETVNNLNKDLDYINSAKKLEVIDFDDYYEKSVEAINATELNEEKLKEDNKVIYNLKKILWGIGAVFGLGFLATVLKSELGAPERVYDYDLGKMRYDTLSERFSKSSTSIIVTTLLSIVPVIGFGNLCMNKDVNEQQYIQEAKADFNTYKEEKFASLDSLKIMQENKSSNEDQ